MSEEADSAQNGEVQDNAPPLEGRHPLAFMAQDGLGYALLASLGAFLTIITYMKPVPLSALVVLLGIAALVLFYGFAQARVSNWQARHKNTCICSSAVLSALIFALVFKTFDPNPPTYEQGQRAIQVGDQLVEIVRAGNKTSADANKEISHKLDKLDEIEEFRKILQSETEARAYQRLSNQIGVNKQALINVRSLINDNKRDEAFELLQNILNLDLASGQKVAAAGTSKIYAAFVVNKDPNKAIDLLKMSNSIVSEDADTNLILLSAYVNKGQFDQAKLILGKAVQQPLDQTYTFLFDVFQDVFALLGEDERLGDIPQRISLLERRIDIINKSGKARDDIVAQVFIYSAKYEICSLDMLTDRWDGAVAACQQARETVRGLLSTFPANPGFTGALASIDTSLASDAVKNGNITLAREAAQESMGYADNLFREDKTNSLWQKSLAGAYAAAGYVQTAEGDNVLAAENFKMAADIYRKTIGHESENNPILMSELKDAEIGLGEILVKSKNESDRKQGLKKVRSGLDIMQTLEKAHPTPVYRHDLATVYLQLGDACRSVKDDAAALEAYKKGVELYGEVIESFPSAKSERIEGQLGAARLLLDQGNKAEALFRLQDALSLSDPESGIDGHNINLWVTYIDLGDAQSRDPQPDRQAAKQSYEKAFALAERFSHMPRWQRLGALASKHIGDAVRYLPQPDNVKAFEAYDKARRFFEAWVQSRPTDNKARSDLADIYDRLGSLREGDALPQYQAALGQRKIAEEQSGADPDYRHDLAVSYDNVAFALRKAGRGAEALKSFEQSMTLRERLAATQPDSDEAKDELVMSYIYVGISRRDKKDVKGALDSLQRAVSIRADQAQRYPDDLGAKSDLLEAETKVAAILTWQEPAKSNEAIMMLKDIIVKQQELVAIDHGSELYQVRLEISYGKLSELLSKPEEALAAAKSALALSEALAKLHPNDKRLRSNLLHDLAQAYSAARDTKDKRVLNGFDTKELPTIETTLSMDTHSVGWQEAYVQMIWDLALLGDPSAKKKATVLEELRDLDGRKILSPMGKEILAEIEAR